MQRQTFLDGQQNLRYQKPNLVEVSFHMLPTLSWNGVSGTGAQSSYDSPGASLRFSVGPTIDMYFSQNRFAASIGLWYTVKSVGFIHPASENGGGSSTYNLQYLQLPLTMKLVSENLLKGARTYVQYGATVDYKLAEKVLDKTNNVFYKRYGDEEQFSAFDVNLLLAVGYVRPVSPTNSVIISLQYQRGLTDVMKSSTLTSQNNLLALGAALSF
jgi:hypothetical protein